MVSGIAQSLLLIAAAAAPFVSAHGKVAVLTGTGGGNGTGLCIMGAVVPLLGSRAATKTQPVGTEADTTTYNSVNGDGLGACTNQGKITVAKALPIAQAQAGAVVPVAAPDGSFSGTWITVVQDGAGPISCILDPTGTGAFSKGVTLKVSVQVPAIGGNRRRDWGLFRRNGNTAVGSLSPFTCDVNNLVQACTGVLPGVDGPACLLKITNSNNNGPFGSTVAVQIAAGGAANATIPATAPTDAAPAPAAASSATAAKGAKGAKGAADPAPAAAAAAPAAAAPAAAPAAASDPAQVAGKAQVVTVTVTQSVCPTAAPTAAAAVYVGDYIH